MKPTQRNTLNAATTALRHALPAGGSPPSPVAAPASAPAVDRLADPRPQAKLTGSAAQQPAPLEVKTTSVTGAGSEAGGALSGQERLQRTDQVLQHFDVPPAPDETALLRSVRGTTTVAEMQRRLAYLDPKGEFRRYSKIVKDPASGLPVLQVFRDRDTKQVLDFEVPLASGDQPGGAPSARRARLLAARTNPASEPLRGLKIAIDPGHMGGKHWDAITGKFIEVPQGYLSEGDMALEAATLLAERLRGLGAQVILTHTKHQAVTHDTYDGLDITQWGRKELLHSVDAPWFQKLISQPGSERQLLARADADPQIKRLFSNKMRWRYFVLRSDLQARAKDVNSFGADLTLVIHFDVALPKGRRALNPHAPNESKAYVPGAFQPGELAGHDDRALFVKHLLDPGSWDDSVALSRSLVSSIDQQMGIPPAQHTYGATKMVAPGVAARNLGLTRMVHDSALSYVEVAYYNRPDEFAAFSDRTSGGVVDGKPRSRRMLELVDALQQGIVNFVRGKAASADTPTARADAARPAS